MLEKVYCISLKNEHIRRQMMIEQLDKQFTNRYEIIDATESGTNITKETFNNLTNKSKGVTAMSQIAICHSHLECIKKIYDNKLTYGAIIEDDIRIVDDIEIKIKKYLDKNPEIDTIMKSKPCVLHLASCVSIKKDLYEFVKCPATVKVVGICFNVMNHQFAKILIDNFYPIKHQFDTYVHFMVQKYKINEFVAIPLLGWDVSSTMYRKYWNSTDKQIHANITTTSKINKIDYTNIIPSYRKSAFNNMYNTIMNKIVDSSKSIISTYDNSTLTYSSSDESLHNMNTDIIVAGHGITDHDNTFIQPKYVLFVRGPITRVKFLEQGYWCPHFYADPLLVLHSNIFTDNTYDYCIFTQEYINISNISSDKFVICDIEDIEKLVEIIKISKTVVTSKYIGIILAHIFNKRILWIKDSRSEQDNIKILDYLLGYKSTQTIKYYEGDEDITKIVQLQVLDEEIREKKDTLLNNYPAYFSILAEFKF